jgi:hypothetical protein
MHRPWTALADDLRRRRPPDDSIDRSAIGSACPTGTDPTPFPRLAICETEVINGAETCVRVGASTRNHRGRRDSLCPGTGVGDGDGRLKIVAAWPGKRQRRIWIGAPLPYLAEQALRRSRTRSPKSSAADVWRLVIETLAGDVVASVSSPVRCLATSSPTLISRSPVAATARPSSPVVSGDLDHCARRPYGLWVTQPMRPRS